MLEIQNIKSADKLKKILNNEITMYFWEHKQLIAQDLNHTQNQN